MKTIKLQFTDFEREINNSLNTFTEVTSFRPEMTCGIERMSVMTAIKHAFWTMTGSWQNYTDIVDFWNGDMTIQIGDKLFVKKGQNKFGL